MSSWRAEVEPSADGRMAALLIDLGLDRQIPWQTAAALLDVYESRTPTRPFMATERDVAFAFIVTGGTANWPDFWQGADPQEAFLLDLSIANPGDGSGLHLRSPEQLLADEVALRNLPRTQWRLDRIFATRSERKRRGAS